MTFAVLALALKLRGRLKRSFKKKKQPNKRNAIISGDTDAKQTRVLGLANGISFQGA